MSKIAFYLDSLNKDSKRCLYDATQLQDDIIPFKIPKEIKDLMLPNSINCKYNKKYLKTVAKPDSPFIDKSIIKMINFKDGYQYNGDKFSLKIFSSNKFNIPFHRIEGCMEILKPKNYLQLTFWETSAKKKIYNKVLGGKDVNSGSSNTNTGEIQLWRKEEFDKVLIHELIHGSKLHFMEINLVNNYILNKFNIIGKLVPFEAFTEWLAVLLHCTFESYELTKTNCLTENLIYNEYLFNLTQCCHLMRHYQIDSWEQLLIKSEPWEQKTDIFSYFILKTALLSNSQYWFQRFPDNWMTCYNQKEFVKWLKHSLRENGKFVQDIKKALKKNLRPSWTLRMTATELIK